jgi:hypothetical protein
MRVHDRIRSLLSEPAVAAVVTAPADGLSADDIVLRLMTLIRSDGRPDEVAVYDGERDRSYVELVHERRTLIPLQ